MLDDVALLLVLMLLLFEDAVLVGGELSEETRSSPPEAEAADAGVDGPFESPVESTSARVTDVRSIADTFTGTAWFDCSGGKAPNAFDSKLP